MEWKTGQMDISSPNETVTVKSVVVNRFLRKNRILIHVWKVWFIISKNWESKSRSEIRWRPCHDKCQFLFFLGDPVKHLINKCPNKKSNRLNIERSRRERSSLRAGKMFLRTNYRRSQVLKPETHQQDFYYSIYFNLNIRKKDTKT